MANCSQNSFQVHSGLMRRWDFVVCFSFLLEQLPKFVIVTLFLSMYQAHIKYEGALGQRMKVNELAAKVILLP